MTSLDSRPSLARLTAVELRKTIDTRAGFLLQTGAVLVTLAVAIIVSVVGHAQDHTLRDVMAAAVQGPVVLLSVVGVLLISSEWSQRTTLITFALVPRRSRVLAAKVLAGIVLSVATVAMSLAVSALVTAVAAPGAEGTWSLSPTVLGQDLLYAAFALVTGFGFGAVLLSSPPAIVLLFALPLAWTALGTIPALLGTARWLDGARSLGPLLEHGLDATEWGRVATTQAVWMLLPVLIGLWRIARSEVG